MVNFGDETFVMAPRRSSSSPLSSSSPASPVGTVDEVTLNVGVTVALVPLIVTDEARSMSKLITDAPVPIVIDGLIGTFTVVDESVAFSLVTALVIGSTMTISGLETVKVAPVYVPLGIVAKDRGSNVARSCVSSTSVGFARTLGLVPPVSVTAFTVNSNAMILSLG